MMCVQVSRCDAVSVAACLLCYGNHFGTLPVLAAHIATPTVIDCVNLKVSRDVMQWLKR